MEPPKNSTRDDLGGGGLAGRGEVVLGGGAAEVLAGPVAGQRGNAVGHVAQLARVGGACSQVGEMCGNVLAEVSEDDTAEFKIN